MFTAVEPMAAQKLLERSARKRLDAQVNENPGMLERDGEPAAKRAKARDRNTWDTIIVI